MLVAACTNAMHWFSALSLWLHKVSEHSTRYFPKFVALSLSIPCFRLSHFFFKIAYTLQQRKLVRLGRKCVALGGHDYSLQFDDLGLDLGTDLQAYYSLKHLACRLEAASGDAIAVRSTTHPP